MLVNHVNITELTFLSEIFFLQIGDAWPENHERVCYTRDQLFQFHEVLIFASLFQTIFFLMLKELRLKSSFIPNFL